MPLLRLVATQFGRIGYWPFACLLLLRSGVSRRVYYMVGELACSC